MKKWFLFALVFMLATLSACTPTIYGVPQPLWETMSETERVEAMRLYQERQIAYQKIRAEQARVRAEELKERKAREAQEERLRRERVEAIHRGKGAYGDLLRVSIKDGRMRIAGKDRGFHPVSFKIADGEKKQVPVVSIAGKRTSLQVAYDGGALLVDGSDTSARSRAARLAYEQEWGRGRTYHGISSEGPSKLRDVAVYVEVLDHSRHSGERHTSPPIIVIKESSPRPPQPTIVIRPPASRPQDRQARTAPVAKPDEVPARIKVNILKGRARIKGKHHALYPVSFHLNEGETRNILLTTSIGADTVTVAYRDGTLIIDDDPAKTGSKKAGAKVKHERGWEKSRLYRIDTRGKMSLKEAEIEITAENGVAD